MFHIYVRDTDAVYQPWGERTANVKDPIGAVEVGRATPEQGAILDTTIKIGDGALQSGAESISVPADQPFGDRNCSVRYAAGNAWYIATDKGGAA